MIVTFEKYLLETAVESALCCVSDKNAIPIIEGIRFCTEANGKCSITSYDLEKGFRTEIDCKIEEPGNYVINASKFYRIVRSLPDLYVRVEINENCRVTISSGKSVFNLHAMDGEAFPILPDLDSEQGFAVKGQNIKKMISQTAFAIAATDQRPMLCGEYFVINDDEMKVIACDGNRLAIRECKCEIENKNPDGSLLDLKFIVPGKTVTQLTRLIFDDDNVSIYIARKHVIFYMENKTFFSRLIDADYIEYERVIPKNKNTIVVANRLDLISSLERAALVTEDRSLGQAKSYVKFTFENKLLKIESVSINGSVYDEMPIEKTGEDVVIGFNCRYMIDAIKAADTDKVEMIANGSLTSITIRPYKDENEEDDGNDYMYMVSPVKMK
ncbi:MAG: DNA polymerase III subunit beta [Clostridia bacterium]|nr:DNA polymerase III subunit beta [Clostridia bacterium]